MSFARALSERLRYLEDNDHHENKGYWYPSQLGFCDRSSVLEHSDVPGNPKDDRSLRVLWLGEKIHDAIKSVHPFEVVGHEVRVRDETYKVSGKMDTLSRLPDGTLEVQEYKSINSRSFTYNDLPRPSHVRQVGVYLLFPPSCPKTKPELLPCDKCGLSGEHGKMESPSRGRLIYISKDDLRIDEFIIRMDDELAKDIKDELLRLEAAYQEYVKSGTLPAPLDYEVKRVKGKESKVKAWQTRYCSYKGTGMCCGDSNATNEQLAGNLEGEVPPEGGDPGEPLLIRS